MSDITSLRYVVLRRVESSDGQVKTQKISAHKKWGMAVGSLRQWRRDIELLGGRLNIPFSLDMYIYDVQNKRCLSVNGNELKDRAHT